MSAHKGTRRRLTLRIPLPLYLSLVRRAHAQGKTVNDVTQEALTAWLT